MVSLLHTYNVNYLKSNQAISGMGINLAMIGMGGFLYLALFGAAIVPPQIPILSNLNIPFLQDLPIWGFVLFQQNILTYLAVFLAVFAEIVLNRSRLGMQIKAVGQNPEAAATAGINVNRVKVASSVFGGVLAGLGGSFLTVNTGFFAQYIINGRGWIAYALARLALPSPIIGIFASLIFGFGLAIQFRLQALQILQFPYEFLLMLPYLFTLVALFVYSVQRKRRRGE
jgi:simple sugar transport system permease protein